jgi:hypothetical protein
MYALRAAVLAVAGVFVISATGVRIGDHPAYVRVVVDFNGRIPANQVVFDRLWTRTAALHVARPNMGTWTNGASGQGVRVSLQPATQRLNIGMSFAARRFKYVSYAIVTGNRLAIDLWKSAPPSRLARQSFPRGCLSIRTLKITNGSITASGTERNVFEHQFQVVVRGANGTVLGRRTAVHGPNWSTTVRYHSTKRQAGTLEAVALSPKDGSLACISQERVTLPAG